MLRVFIPCFVLRSMSLQAYMFRSTCLGFLFHVFMLRSMSLHAYIFRSTWLEFYAMFPLFHSSLCFALMLGLCAHVLDTMSMVMLCSDLCARMLFAMFYA